MDLTPQQMQSLLRSGDIRRDLASRSTAEVEEIGKAFSAANRLRELEANPAFHEQELARQFDVALGLSPEPSISERSYGASEEDELQRQFDVYTKVTFDPNEGLPVGRAFSAQDADGDTPEEVALARAFDEYLGIA